MNFQRVRRTSVSLMWAALTLTATAAAPSTAWACGCCKGGEPAAGQPASQKGCMGGADAKSGKGGMSCMGGMDMGGKDMAMSQSKSDDTMMAGMDHSKMDMGGQSAASTGNPDVDFAKAMIPHHKGAVDMANEVMKNGKDPDIKKLAESMIATQEKEIDFLNAWLAKQPK